MSSYTEFVEDDNLSVAWGRAFLRLMERGVDSLSPLVVVVQGFNESDVQEDPTIRAVIDCGLTEKGQRHCDTVANTIFPNSYWNRIAGRQELYRRYNRAWPRIKRVRANRGGTYFKRLIAYGDDGGPFNQLEHVLQAWEQGVRRRSALQLSIFDPEADNTNSPLLGFPCLHQVAINPLGPNGENGLAITGFYATQYIFERAYGNYLGLCRLGIFVAHELKLKLARMTCVASQAQLGGFSKGSLLELKNQVEREMERIHAARLTPATPNDD